MGFSGNVEWLIRYLRNEYPARRPVVLLFGKEQFK
jgi:hypothetical protein